jgi:hypothetical protein
MSLPAWLILAALACSGAYAWHDSRSREELAAQIKRTQEELVNLNRRSESLEEELSERIASAGRRAVRSAPAPVSGVCARKSKKPGMTPNRCANRCWRL